MQASRVARIAPQVTGGSGVATVPVRLGTVGIVRAIGKEDARPAVPKPGDHGAKAVAVEIAAVAINAVGAREVKVAGTHAHPGRIAHPRRCRRCRLPLSPMTRGSIRSRARSK